MTDREKKAIEVLKQYISNPYDFVCDEEVFLLLSLLEEQEKVIDEMARMIDKSYLNTIPIATLMEKRICAKLKNPKEETDDCYRDVYDEKACIKCIKEFFYRKVENNE